MTDTSRCAGGCHCVLAREYRLLKSFPSLYISLSIKVALVYARRYRTLTYLNTLGPALEDVDIMISLFSSGLSSEAQAHKS